MIAPVVVKGERAQKDREGRRRGDRASHRDLREVGAEEIELVLRELEARAERHVGGVEQHVGTTTRLLQERGERGAFEYHFVVEVGGEIDPAVVGAEETHPVPGRQRAGDQFTLDVAVEKVLLEPLEPLDTEEGVVRGREASARHRGDHVDVREQRALGVGGRPVRNRLQTFEEPVGERGRSGPAAGEGEDDEQLLLGALATDFRVAIAVGPVGVQAGVDGPRRASRQRRHECGHGETADEDDQHLWKATQKGSRIGRSGTPSRKV